MTAGEADPLCQKVGVLELAGDMTAGAILEALRGLYIATRLPTGDRAVRDHIVAALDRAKAGPQRH
jgi:hypothetical protein